jgi:peptidoglycan/LPS O-acetylase OafA/YrhL
MNLQKSLLRYWGFFAVGMLFADFYQNQNGWIKGKKSFLFDVIGLICFSFLLGNYPITLDNFWFKNIHSFNYIWVFPFFLSVFRGKILSWIFTLPWIVIFGGMCYTIYLIHYPILFLLGGKVLPFLPKANPVGFWEVYIPFLLISFVVLALFSAVFFVIFEKPFMYKDWPEKWQAAIKSRFRKSNT